MGSTWKPGHDPDNDSRSTPEIREPDTRIESNDSDNYSPGTSGIFNNPHFELSQHNLRELERSVSPFEISKIHGQGEQLQDVEVKGVDEVVPPKPKRRGPNMDFPNFVEVIQEQIDLRMASSNNPTAVLELDMNGCVRHLSKNWEIIVGTNIKKIVGKPISNIILGNHEEDNMVFYKALEQMIRDDGSYKVKFITPTNDRICENSLINTHSSGKTTPNNSLEDLSSTLEGDNNPKVSSVEMQRQEEEGKNRKHESLDNSSTNTDNSDLTTNGEIIELEAQGILIHDYATKLPTHSMWTIKPFIVVNLDLQLPPSLINLLGFGSEFFEGYLINLKELGIINEEAVPQPKSILCRICEQHVPVWFIERHSELCIVEHRVNEDLQACHDLISDQRDLILKITESYWNQQQLQQLHQQQQQQQRTSKEGSLTPPGSSPLAGSPNSSTSSLPGSPSSPAPQIQDYKGIKLPPLLAYETSQPILSSLLNTKKFPFGILQRLVQLCDEALQINPVEEIGVKEDFKFSPNTERAITSVANWRVFETNDLAIRTMVEDTQRLTRDKIETLSRLVSVLQFSKKIKNEVDELVLETVRETVCKIKEQTNLNENEYQTDADDDSSINDQTISEKVEGLNFIVQGSPDVSLDDSQTIQSTPIETIIHSPQPSRTRSPPTNKLFSEAYDSPRSTSPSGMPTMSQSITPKDFLLRGRLPYDISKNNSSSSSSSVRTNSRELTLLESFNDLDVSGNQIPKRRGRENMSNNSSISSPRRHLSPAPYVEKQTMSSFQRNSNSRFDTNNNTPMSSPSIQHSEVLGDSIVTGSASIGGNNSSGFPLPEKRVSSGGSLSNPAPYLGPLSSKSSTSKPPLSPLLVSSTPSSKPSSGSIKDYDILKAISKGAFGSVFLARRKLTGDYVAIKCLKKTDMIAKNQILNVKSERAVMMRQSDSPYVAQLYSSFQTKDYLYLVMEYLNGGDCATLLSVLGTLGNQWAKRYIAEVIVGVDDLHGRGIIHRDLKPDNLLIDSKGHLKLTDFGLSRMGVIGRQTRTHRKSSTSDQSIEFFRKSLTQAGSSPLVTVSGFGSTGSTSDSSDFHKRTSSVTPFSLSPTLDQIKLSTSFSASPNSSANILGETSSTAGTIAGNGTVGRSGSINTPPFRLGRSGSNLSGGLESPLLRPLPRTSSETSFALIDDDFQVSPHQNAGNITSYALYDPQNEDVKKFVGTPDYLAPETISGVGQSEASDWWSLGCMLFEFIFGYPPFHADTPEMVFENILAGKIDWPPLSTEEELEICPPDAKDLIQKLLVLNPEERLGSNGAEEIENHPYFKGINWENLFTEVPSFIPTPDNPESTDYFDSRGADISQFPKEDSDEEKNYQDEERKKYSAGTTSPNISSTINTTELGSPSISDSSLMPAPQTKRERRGSRLADPTEFGSFNFRNLSVLEKANKDVINRLKTEHLEHRNSFSSSSSESISYPATRGFTGTGPGSPFKRPVSPQNRAISPAKQGEMHVAVPSPQIFGTKHERVGSAASMYSSGDEFPFELSKGSPLSENSKLYKTGSESNSITGGIAHKSSVSSLSKQVLKSLNDFSPSSSDTEDSKSSALLRVRKRRQSSRAPGSFSMSADTSRPTFHEIDVLYCEPIPIVRHSIARLLEKLGCIVVTVSDGDELVRRATSQVKFDIIFTALKLPKVEAPDAVKLIRYTTGLNANTTIVAITGFAKEALQTGCFNDVLEKPIDLNMLRTCLAHSCNWGPMSRNPGDEEAIESDTEKS
ncbi:serine/threonine-protein kinase Rim15p [[Candida] anglica]|uniref:non-specific serine/threonine protein kinase n=1 Tax=[Candida] anglica TaxID=148631 RepID=A0ABP0ED53_9ASCO